jgi:hypothetical protein
MFSSEICVIVHSAVVGVESESSPALSSSYGVVPFLSEAKERRRHHGDVEHPYLFGETGRLAAVGDLSTHGLYPASS